MATLGYVRSSNGPDLAQVGVNEQLVSHTFPNTTGETLRITSISAWVGNWSGTATMRFGIWAASSSSAAPGALLARTVEFSPTTNYVDAAGGQLRTAALESPFDLAPGQVIALGVASRNNSAGIAMYQASSISQPNENFYRKGISGTNLQSASGSSVSNEGHLAIYITGETNDPPHAPVLVNPPGVVTSGTRTPLMSIRHRDPNGHASSQARVIVQTSGGSARWDHTWNTRVADGVVTNTTYAGSTLLYHTTYRWRALTRDTHGAWSSPSDFRNFVLRHNNRSPHKPSNFSGLGYHDGSREITVESDFTDPDYPLLSNGQSWEVFTQKRVIVRRLADNHLIYNSDFINTTTSERANARSSTTITLPEWDVRYRWEEQHRDRMGAWSAFATGWVEARSGGSVEKPRAPEGRVTNLSNPGSILFTYNSTAGLLGDRIRVGVFWPNGSGPRTQRDVNAASVPGVEKAVGWSVLWNDIGGFPFPEEGTDWLYAVKVRDTAGNWTEWSPFQELNLNARPDTPYLWSPPDGDPIWYKPTLQVMATDPDQVATELDVRFEVATDSEFSNVIINEHGQYMAGGSRPGTRGRFDLSLASETLPIDNTYYWRARASDGHLESAWTPTYSFTYANVPEVTITSPAGPVITTSQPLLEWDSVGQTGWRIVGRDDDQNIVYDTGEQSGGTQQYAISGSQHWIGGERWNNEETFHWTVRVQDSTMLWGNSSPLTLTVEYVPPTPVTVQAVDALPFPGADGTHYTAISIDQAAYEEGRTFRRYIVDRVEIDGPDGAEIEGTIIPAHFETGNSADTDFADFDMTSNQWYRYAIRYEVQAGVDIIESEPVYAEAMASWHGTLLHMPFDPLSTYVWLPFGEDKYVPEVAWHQGHSEVMTTNGRAPLGYSDSTDYVEWQCTSTLVPRDDATTEQQRDALRKLWKYQNARFAPNGRPNSVCFREGRGGDDGRVYGRMSEPNRRHSYTRLYTIDFMFRELEEIPAEGGEQ